MLALSIQGRRKEWFGGGVGKGKVEKGIPFPSLNFLSKPYQEGVRFAFL